MKKSITKMTTAELGKATAEFNGSAEPKFLRAPPAEKRRHDAAVRKVKNLRGRPRTGQGARRVQISMERALLHDVDRLATATGITRSELLARGAKILIKRAS